jgi:hypothetical protein
MSWEWVGPTATAVVGVVGISATWATARGQQKAQMRMQQREHREARNKELRADRRRLYAAMIGELHAVESMLLAAQSDTVEGLSGAEGLARMQTLWRLGGEVTLVSSPAVYQATVDATANALGALAEGVEGVHDGEAYKALLDSDRKLMNLMIYDLRIAPAASRDDLLAAIKKADSPTQD